MIITFTVILNNRSPKTEYDYISAVYSEAFIGNNSEEIVTSILYFEPETGTSKKIFEFEYTSQYPLGVYRRENNSVYYTKNVDGMDQIFSYDLNFNTEKQLTNNLFAINYIFPTEDKVFFVARPNNSRTVKLGFINKLTEEIIYWLDDGDTNVESFVIDTKSEKIFISTFSEDNRQNSVITQTNNNFDMPLYTVYETDFNFSATKKIFSDNVFLRKLMTNNTNLVVLGDEKYNSVQPSIMYYYDFNSNDLTKSTWNFERLQIGDANFSSDGKVIYSLVSYADKRSLCMFDLNTNKFTPIYIPNDGFINSITVFKKK